MSLGSRRIIGYVTKAVCIGLMLMQIPFMSGCDSKGRDNAPDDITLDPEHDYYSSVSDMKQFCGTDSVINAFRLGDYICIVTYDWDQDSPYRMYMYDDDLSEISYIDIDPNCKYESMPRCCPLGDDRLVMTTNDGFVIYDRNGKEISRNKDPLANSYERPGLAGCDEGFVFITSNAAYKFDENGRNIGTIEGDLGFSSWGESYFERGSDEYFVGQEGVLYQLDFDAGSVTALYNLYDIGVDVDRLGAGGLYYDDYRGSIFSVDGAEQGTTLCALRSHMLVKPETYNAPYSEGFYFLGKDEYIIVDPYIEGLHQITRVYRDDGLNIDEREKIVVKGYGITSDKPLQLAAYLYNTSQQDYYVSVENYGDEYGYTTALEAQDVKLRLIKEFNSGNAPDIFYGNDFDYEYWGRTGLVIDMSSYLKNSSVIVQDDMFDNCLDLMNNGGHCYQLFNGIKLHGLFAAKGLMDDNAPSDYSLFDDNVRSKSMSGYYLSSDIADFMIRYPVQRILNRDGLLSNSEISQILSYSYEMGLSSEEKYSDSSYVINGDEDLGIRQMMIGSPVYYLYEAINNGELRFIGYPTVDGTVHSAVPAGLVAISAGSDHPDECFRFIEYMFTVEAQECQLNQHMIPVNRTVYDKFIEALKDPGQVSPDDYQYRFLVSEISNSFFPSSGRIEGYYDVPDGMLDDFRGMIESVDSLITMDWGMYNIIAEEVESHYLQGKTIPEVAESLHNRLLLYVQENY